MGNNWILSMIRAGFKNNFRLLTTDQISYNRYSTFIKQLIQEGKLRNTTLQQYVYPMYEFIPKETTFIKPWEDNRNPFHFGKKAFKLFTCARPAMLKTILQKLSYAIYHKETDSVWNYDGLFYMDLDIFMYKSKRIWDLKLFEYLDADIVLGRDSPGTQMCSCLIFIPNIYKKTQYGGMNELYVYMDEWFKICNRSDNRDDQSALYKLTGMLESSLQTIVPNFTYHLFNQNEFPNGYKFQNKWWVKRHFRNKWWKSDNSSNEIVKHNFVYNETVQKDIDYDKDHPYMMHANYLENKGMNKVEFLRKFNAWLVPSNETLKAFLQNASLNI
eukprot:445420_1